MNICRVTFSPVNLSLSGVANLILDLVIDVDGKPHFKLPIGGYIGKPGKGQPNMLPFLLYADGTMDFGDDSEDHHENDDDRFEKSDIYCAHKRVLVGEYINVTRSGEEHVYRIAKVTPYGVFRLS